MGGGAGGPRGQQARALWGDQGPFLPYFRPPKRALIGSFWGLNLAKKKALNPKERPDGRHGLVFLDLTRARQVPTQRLSTPHKSFPIWTRKLEVKTLTKPKNTCNDG